ncbi:MAG: TylF/MycF/NovP-related O-methyltransferase [Pseudomonadota bacterium]
MRLKSIIEDLLRDYPPLFRFASRVYHTINGSFRTLSPGAPGAIQKSFEMLLERDGAVSGDYYEFGLFRGYTFLEAYKCCKNLNLNDVNFYGFDSFEGLPEAEGIDQVDGRFFKGQFACSRDAVEKSLQKSGVDLDEVQLVEGYYEDSLTDELHDEHAFQPVAVALLDCDYYSSTVTALTWLDRYVHPGSVLLFDDWFSYGENEELGQQKAFQEFLDRHPEWRADPLWEFENHGKGFVIVSA